MLPRPLRRRAAPGGPGAAAAVEVSEYDVRRAHKLTLSQLNKRKRQSSTRLQPSASTGASMSVIENVASRVK